MGLIREPIDVDFYIQSKPLTDKEHKEISEVIRKRKAANLLREERRTARKATKPVRK